MLNKQVNEPTSEGRKGEMTKQKTRLGSHTVRLREVLTAYQLLKMPVYIFSPLHTRGQLPFDSTDDLDN